MLFYKENPNKPIFYFSFVHMILKINGIKSKEEDLVEAPKILDECGVSMMRYYRDTDGMYYYLEKSGRKVYDDKIVEPIKDPSNETSESSFGFLSVDVKTYLDEMVEKILVENQIRE
ncbi:unnamed protein product [Vicia faba]|uniref:Uncharacterized protein n=1 Tax=Vicia faba TaxID=3906 RepID=A0AAV0ZH72_VICFA|nr:unnamed protein product [Vicia faba]